jgi:hypothetical protein
MLGSRRGWRDWRHQQQIQVSLRCTHTERSHRISYCRRCHNSGAHGKVHVFVQETGCVLIQWRDRSEGQQYRDHRWSRQRICHRLFGCRCALEAKEIPCAYVLSIWSGIWMCVAFASRMFSTGIYTCSVANALWWTASRFATDSTCPTATALSPIVSLPQSHVTLVSKLERKSSVISRRSSLNDARRSPGVVVRQLCPGNRKIPVNIEFNDMRRHLKLSMWKAGSSKTFTGKRHFQVVKKQS